MEPSMMKILRSENAQVVGLGGNRTRCIHQGDWLTNLAYENGILTVLVIPETTLFLEAGIMLLLPNNMYQSHPINSK